MSDARQSPIPQDRVNENIGDRDLADASKQERRQQDRRLMDQGIDDRPGTHPQEQPGIPEGPTSPAEGGD